ncbi:molybdopterin molybdotransferase MoeA [Ferrovibrio terrae]|uniref:Molybdopterin molybdenumtransferase n=1 Tax=Ferrovibrio terrae TaxID=2594003 RepID=A0A516H519_9PROT|nr:gephyrin-like molybdotransferase Glp [Ferrovibrio terrae]QDO98894.1 molybdopterin molybdotransferase MoeA [Ferrovibrio terrae]
MIPVREARSRIVAALPQMAAETVAVSAASGRVLAQDVAARRTQPPFDVSAMDGWACRQADLGSIPAKLKPVGHAAAGGRHDGTVGTGECVRIFTGAPLPDGADAIVIQEDADLAGDILTVREAPKPGQWIRKAGLDFAEGQVLLSAGRLLGPADVALAAAMNVPWLQVRRQPRIAVLATGDELARPGEPIGPNQIVSSNNIGLCALVEANGGVAVDLGIARDTETDLREKAAASAGCDLLLTLGGASVGEHDLIHKILGGGGKSIDFWNIAMRPGKPLMFGRVYLGNGASIPLLGLPGNPVSALVCGHNFLLPAMRAMLGLDWEIRFETAISSADLSENDKREDYLRATLQRQDDGQLVATAFGKQDSSMLRRLSDADCLIVRPSHDPAIKAGMAVPILRLR